MTLDLLERVWDLYIGVALGANVDPKIVRAQSCCHDSASIPLTLYGVIV